MSRSSRSAEASVNAHRIGSDDPIVRVAGKVAKVRCFQDGALGLSFGPCQATRGRRYAFVVYLNPRAADRVRARLRRFPS